MGKRISKADFGRILLAAFFFVLLLLPLFRMLMNISRESMVKILTSAGFGSAVRNSVVSAGVSTLISVILAYTAAVCTERVENRLKGLFWG